MGDICVSAGIADSTLNQTLAVAYRNQIRNADTRLFAQTGKPRTWRVLTRPPTPWCRRRKWGNQRRARPKTKQSATPAPASIPALRQRTSRDCVTALRARSSLYGSGDPVNRRTERGRLNPHQCSALDNAWHQAAKDGYPLNALISIRPEGNRTPLEHAEIVGKTWNRAGVWSRRHTRSKTFHIVAKT